MRYRYSADVASSFVRHKKDWHSGRHFDAHRLWVIYVFSVLEILAF